MTQRRGQARPYRVVFTDAPREGALTGRRGTFAKADLEEATREAQNIARSGKTAEVYHVTATGEREIMAVYTPNDVNPPITPLCDALFLDAPTFDCLALLA